MTGLLGHITTLDPTVELWWPSAGEHETYVIGRAITRDIPTDKPIPAIGLLRAVTGMLEAPLGDRVLVDENGEPLAVLPAG
jgi:hypothetical protein